MKRPHEILRETPRRLSHGPYILAILSLIFILSGCQSQNDRDSSVTHGQIELEQPLQDDEVLRLDGTWAFFWQDFVLPASDIAPGWQEMKVPGSWNGQLDPPIQGSGHGTYRLVLVHADSQEIGMRIPRIFTSYELWINGEKITQVGQVGNEAENTTPRYQPQVVRFQTVSGENEILLHVANFSHRSGGILESLTVGNYETMRRSREMAVAMDLVLFGSLTVIGLYHLALYLFRKKNRAQLFFGVFSGLVGIRTLFVGERFIQDIWPSLSWEIAHKIQTLTFYIGLPLIMMFFSALFADCFHRRVVKLITAISLGFSLVVFFTPARIFTQINPAYQILTLLVIAYIVSGLLRILKSIAVRPF